MATQIEQLTEDEVARLTNEVRVIRGEIIENDKSSLMKALNAGDRLTQLKLCSPHGKRGHWEDFIETQFTEIKGGKLSVRTAQLYMDLADFREPIEAERLNRPSLTINQARIFIGPLKGNEPPRPETVEIIRSLEFALAATTESKIVEQADCFIFLNGEVLTYNDTQFHRAPCEIAKHVTGAVKAPALMKRLRKLVAKSLRFSQGEGTLIIRTSKNREYEIELERDIRSQYKKWVNAPEAWNWKELHPEFNEVALQLTSEELDVATDAKGELSTNFRLAQSCLHIFPHELVTFDEEHAVRHKMNIDVAAPIAVRKKSIRKAAKSAMTHFAESTSWLHFRDGEGRSMACSKYALVLVDEPAQQERELSHAS